MISLLVPSRGNPKRLETMIKSVEDTVLIFDNVQIVIRLDSDDNCLDDYYKIPCNISRVTLTREPTFPDMGRLWNEAYRHSYGDIVQLAADDLVYRTKCWDQMVIDEFNKSNDKMLLVYGKDGGMNEKLSTHPFVSRQWVDTLGYLAPPYGLVYGNDDWIFLIAKELERLNYLPDMLIEHQPVRAGNRMREFKKLSTMQVYSEWGRLLRQQAVNKLRREMNA